MIMEINKIIDSINVLNAVVEEIVLNWSKLSKLKIKELFNEIFADNNQKLINHLIDRWYDQNKDIAGFYLGIDQKVRRQLFNYYHIELEPEKYKESVDTWKAIVSGKSRWEVFPFQTQLVHQFYLMANNNSLELLEDIVPEGYERVKKRKIDLFGNGTNWSKAWWILNAQEKGIMIEYLLNNKF